MPEPSADPVTAPEGEAVVAAGVQTLVLDSAAAPEIKVEKSATKKLGVAGWLAIIWLVAVITFASGLVSAIRMTETLRTTDEARTTAKEPECTT